MITPWIHSARVDVPFVLAPAWLVAIVVLARPDAFDVPTSPFAWLVLVVGFDVAHVYATLFRTYLDPRERAAHGMLLTFVPLACWLAAVLAYAMSTATFWTFLAYAAVFHFVRQQYGLAMLYATRDERANPLDCMLDAAAVYAATLYPLVHWHTHLPRAFDWFVAGDFLPLPGWIEPVARVAYAGVFVAYAARAAWRVAQGAALNVPKHAIIIGTAMSWYVGIVAFDADLAFTFTNVLAHAVPYFALVWIYGHNRERRAGAPSPAGHPSAMVSCSRPWFRGGLAVAPLVFVVALAYFEEGLWDALVWREHGDMFPAFTRLLAPASDMWLAVLVPLLILPQLVHYVLDAFIWRLRTESTWRETLLWARRQRA